MLALGRTALKGLQRRLMVMKRAEATFLPVPERPSFPEEEEKILAYWTSIDAFQTSLRMSQGKPKYSFYDGPPFATGLPHHGHIAAGTIKDIVTRYWHQNGFHVDRRFGWDCHGLPIEFEINKEEGIKTKKDVLNIGIQAYNEKCRSIVMRYAGEWRRIVPRLGRWIDFDRDYKTMDLNYMESCWAVFKILFEKGLVYRSARVMPFSVGCNTVLSNFEANMDYQEVSDPSVMVTFPTLANPLECFLAWTTTPWTLPSNLALAVNPNFDYLYINEAEEARTFIVAEPLLPNVLKELRWKKHTVAKKVRGSDLVGTQYTPLFPDYEAHRAAGCFQVYAGEFVTNEAGTGIVHCAPFGEDDFKLFVAHGLVRPENPPDPLDENGVFNEQVPSLTGLYFKQADDVIKERLKKESRLVASGTIKHSYPFCWRSQQPLIYRPVKSWFIRVESFKDQLVANNLKTRWVPSFVQEKRFHNWLQEAKDWCFSRNRFWGNPIPLWVSDDFEEIVCVGSVQELKDLTGATDVTDIHRHFIDHLTIPSRQGKGMLHRIEEVFDCWYESGCMPFSQSHYPFDTPEEQFSQIFPADFIAEGLDQTRGWFYTLMVLSTAVRDQPAFKNVIVNGIALDKHGKKMSKSKKNYTDPMELVAAHGADAIRLYLVNGPLVRAEPLKFKDEGVRDTVKDVFLPWFNAYRFFIQNANRYESKTESPYVFDSASCTHTTNLMDRWILAAANHLVTYVRQEMENYRLYTVVPALLKFLNELTNWYVRLNRARLKGETSAEDWKEALDVLLDSIMKVNLLMAPFTPFITELMYQNLSRGLPADLKQASVHFVMIPKPDPSFESQEIRSAVSRMQAVVETVRLIRDRKKLPIKTPVQRITVLHRDQAYLDSLAPLLHYIKEEVNTEVVDLVLEESEKVVLTATPNNQLLGQRLQKAFTPALRKAIAELTHDQIVTFEREGRIELGDQVLTTGEIQPQRKYRETGPDYDADGDNDMVTVVDVRMNEALLQTGAARELVNAVQKLRKAAGLNVTDEVALYYEDLPPYFQGVLRDQGKVLSMLRIPLLAAAEKTEGQRFIAEGKVEHGDSSFKFALYWRAS